MPDVIPPLYKVEKYAVINGKLAAQTDIPAMIKKLTVNMFVIFLSVTRCDSPTKYPNDMKPKKIAIMIDVITALLPT